MKILFTGDYLPDYNRTAIIKKGLMELGHQIFELPFKKKSKSVKSSILETSNECDFIFLPSFTHQQVSFVRKVVGNEKILIFDPLISRYLTKVYDYKLVFKYSLSALRNYFRDRWSMEDSSFIFCDTEAHKNYFHQTFKIPLNKMGVLYIGNDFSKFKPIEKSKKSIFRVGFYGGFIPLQGVMNILGAVKILGNHHDLEFYLIGSGFEYEKAMKFVQDNNLKQVIFPGWISEADLCEQINTFDIALGIFGGTEKSNLVIPNKVYHYGSCAKAVITQDSPAIHELFIHGSDLWLTGTSPQEIADAILLLKSNEQLRVELGRNIYDKIYQEHSSRRVAEKFISYYIDIKNKSSY